MDRTEQIIPPDSPQSAVVHTASNKSNAHSGWTAAPVASFLRPLVGQAKHTQGYAA